MLQSPGSSRPSLALSNDRARTSLSASYVVAQVAATSAAIHVGPATDLSLQCIRAHLSVPSTKAMADNYCKPLSRKGTSMRGSWVGRSMGSCTESCKLWLEPGGLLAVLFLVREGWV